MQKTVIKIILIGQLMWACAYENEEELFGAIPCHPQVTTYSMVIEPILAENCALPSCHDGSNPSLPDWTVVENVQQQAEEIQQRTGNRTMPPSGSNKLLTSVQIANIACWVDNGALDN